MSNRGYLVLYGLLCLVTAVVLFVNLGCSADTPC